jgi:DNA-binding transcriptional MerR regulator
MSKTLTIGQVAAATGLSTHTLRYYEQAGLLHAVGRTSAGHRLYSPADLDWLQFVMRLKATGMPIAGMQAFARLRPQGVATIGERRELLASHRDAVLARIAELQANLSAIVDKIDWYENATKRSSRHDEFSQLQKEQDSSWKTQSTQSRRTAAATREGGKN